MGWLGTVACLLACWLAAGCDYTSSAAETGAFACTNSLDEDGDGKTDCSDPDCWGYARCILPQDASLPLGAAEPPPAPPEVPNAMGMSLPPIVDASIPIETPDAEGVLPTKDSSVDAELPPECDVECADCVDGVCMTPTSLGSFIMTSLEIAVPRVVNARCLDDSAACGALVGCCTPDPDIYVSIAGKKVGSASVNDAAVHVWNMPGFAFELHEGDLMTLELFDDDSEDDDRAEDAAVHPAEPIFDCSTQVRMNDVRAGFVRCAPGLEGQVLGNPYGVTARFIPASDAP